MRRRLRLPHHIPPRHMVRQQAFRRTQPGSASIANATVLTLAVGATGAAEREAEPEAHNSDV
eukprot:12913667-Prorocentrum_lima.AAC.1